MRPFAKAACVLLATTLASTSFAAPDAEPSASQPASLPRAGVDELRTLIAESAERDEVVVIDFWATWCVPCVAMFPKLHEGLVELKEQGRPVRAVTVTLDDADTDFERKAIAFLAEHDALQDAYIAPPDGAEQERLPKELGQQWDNLVVPAVLVFDPDGQLAAEFLNGPGDVPNILDRVSTLTDDSRR